MRFPSWISLALALAGVVGPATATTPASSRTDEPSGDRTGAQAASVDTLRVVFPARRGVCAAGDGIVVREPDGTIMVLHGSVTRFGERWDRDPPCEAGDVFVTLTGHDGRWSVADVAVEERGGDAPGRPGTERLSGQDAVDFLLAGAPLAEPRAARRMILAAALADALVWPRLASLARDGALDPRVRKSAVHWLGRQAAAEVDGELDGLIRDGSEDAEIREAAVFALSQLPEERAIPLLIDVVRTVDDSRVRSRALFWLADFNDPRAVSLFEEILAGDRR